MTWSPTARPSLRLRRASTGSWRYFFFRTMLRLQLRNDIISRRAVVRACHQAQQWQIVLMLSQVPEMGWSMFHYSQAYWVSCYSLLWTKSDFWDECSLKSWFRGNFHRFPVAMFVYLRVRLLCLYITFQWLNLQERFLPMTQCWSMFDVQMGLSTLPSCWPLSHLGVFETSAKKETVNPFANHQEIAINVAI